MEPLMTQITVYHITKACYAIRVVTNAVDRDTNFLQDSLGCVSELLWKLGNCSFAKA